MKNLFSAVVACLLAGAAHAQVGPVEWAQIPSSAACGLTANTTTGVISCSSGGGITALTGDVTASGTGSVAAAVVSIGGKTVSLGGSFVINGAFSTTFTVTATTALTLPTSGTLITTAALPSAGATQLYVGTGAAGAAAALSASGGGTANFLRADMTWASPSGAACANGGGTASVICGGGSGGANTAAGTNSATIGGDTLSTGNGSNGFAAGGHNNSIANGNNYETVIGGQNNALSGGSNSAIVGGTGNTVNGNGSNFIAGGDGNTASNGDGFVTGLNNTVSGQYSMAAGSGDTASGDHSFVGGQNSNCNGTAILHWAWGSQTCTGSYTAVFGQSAAVNSSHSLYAGNIPTGNGADASFKFGGGASNGRTANGAQGFGFYNVACEITGASACELKDPSGNRISVNFNNQAFLTVIRMVAVDRTASPMAFATWSQTNALIFQQASAASTAVSGSNPTFVAGPTGGTFPTCATLPTLTADTSGGNLIVTSFACAGNAHTIEVQAMIETVEIRGNY